MSVPNCSEPVQNRVFRGGGVPNPLSNNSSEQNTCEQGASLLGYAPMRSLGRWLCTEQFKHVLAGAESRWHPVHSQKFPLIKALKTRALVLFACSTVADFVVHGSRTSVDYCRVPSGDGRAMHANWRSKRA